MFNPSPLRMMQDRTSEEILERRKSDLNSNVVVVNDFYPTI